MPRTRFGITLEAKHDFGGSIPSGSNVFRHVARILLRIRRKATCKTEITNFELAISIDQQIARLQIAVQNIGRVDVLEAAQDLVNK